MKIGGPAKYFINVRSENGLIKVVNWAKENKIKWYVVGDGSNLVPSDLGFNGLVIKNEIEDFQRNGSNVFVGAGNNLLKFIHELNRLGLNGMEKMAGIPGTVGGAIYGSAGAYGQEIKDRLARVKIFDATAWEHSARSFPSGTRWLSKKQCQFGYRESIFKKNKNWVILTAEFEFKKEDPKKLFKISRGIIKLREQKYWPGLLCPGSFFKNIVIKDLRPAPLRQKFLKRIDKTKINHGKVPAGYLLEEISAKGIEIGDIKVAKHHGNLIYNSGRGKSSEIVKLAKILKGKVREKFGINLDEEVQYI